MQMTPSFLKAHLLQADDLPRTPNVSVCLLHITEESLFYVVSDLEIKLSSFIKLLHAFIVKTVI